MTEQVMATSTVKTSENSRLKFRESREPVRISNFLKGLLAQKGTCKTKVNMIYDFKASKMPLNKVRNSKD